MTIEGAMNRKGWIRAGDRLLRPETAAGAATALGVVDTSLLREQSRVRGQEPEKWSRAPSHTSAPRLLTPES